MDYKPKQFFREHKADDINGFTIIDVSDTMVRIAEKRDDSWVKPFLMPHGELDNRRSRNECEYVGLLPDEKYDAVLRASGVQ